MRTCRTLFSAAAALAVALTVVIGPPAGATGPATGAPQFRDYVALGDSYTSGPLIPLPRLDPLGCGRSTSNYPALLARKLRVHSYSDVSCGGADTSHMTSPQDVLLGPNPPQFDALRPGTDLVTVGIGGNDHGVFGTLVGTCPELRDEDPAGSPCQDRFTVDGVDTIRARIADTQESVTEVLRGIHERAPEATVLLIGYPRIAPPSGYCPDVLPFAEGDYAWLNSIEEALNTALANAAAADGLASYVDTFGPSLGHDACQPRGTAWINGQHTNLFAALNYHPFYTGMAGVAEVTYDHLTTVTSSARG